MSDPDDTIRALTLLLNAVRTSPALRDAVLEVERGFDALAARCDALEHENAALREALFNHGYGHGLCRCDWCAALAATDIALAGERQET